VEGERGRSFAWVSLASLILHAKTVEPTEYAGSRPPPLHSAGSFNGPRLDFAAGQGRLLSRCVLGRDFLLVDSRFTLKGKQR